MKIRIAILPVFFAVNSFGQILFDESRTFYTENVEWNLHNLAADVLDSSLSKECPQIDITGVYSRFLFGKIYRVISFYYVNDTTVRMKESWPQDPGYGIDSSILLKKLGSYIERDKDGLPRDIKTIRDSAGYKITTYQTNMAGSKPYAWSLYTRVHDPKGRLLSETNAGGGGSIQYTKYGYSGDTTLINTFYDSRKDRELKVTKSIIRKKGRIITKTIMICRQDDYPPSHPWTEKRYEVKIYNEANELSEIRLDYGGRMRIRYYKK